MTNGDFNQTFNKIQNFITALTLTPEDERVLIYKSIDPLLLDLEGELKRSPNVHVSEKIDELKVHLIALARLDEPDGHSDDQHLGWASEALEELRASDVFGGGAG